MSKDIKSFLYPKSSIDSLKIRIKLSKIEILDTTILDTKTKYLISDATGEILEETQVKHLSKEIYFEHYSIKVAIVSLYDFTLKTIIDYLEIYLHSKILEENYFEGINIQNIERIHSKLMEKKVFKVSFEDFLTSNVNDIDIKKDFIATSTEFKDLTTYLKKIASHSTRRNVGAHRYANGNIEFNTRQTSTTRRPFLKLYCKELEATERKSEFFTFYIEPELLINLKRIEATLKKTKDLKQALNLSEATLLNLLKCSSNQLNDIIENSVNINLKDHKEIKVKKSAITRNNNLDKLIYIHLANTIRNQNMLFEDSLQMTLEHFSDKQNRYRLKQKMTKIYLEEIANKDDKLFNTRRTQLLQSIGWKKS